MQAGIRARGRSRKEMDEDAAAARTAALNTSLDDSSSKGFKLMAKLGYKAGQPLGRSADARTEPIPLALKPDRGGIGLDAATKRKVAEAAEAHTKKARAKQVGYRDRIRGEREEKRLDGLLLAAQKVAETLDDDDDEGVSGPQRLRPLSSIDVRWRGLRRRRMDDDLERRMRADWQHSVSPLPTYHDPDLDRADLQALGREEKRCVVEEEDGGLAAEDAELVEFESLPAADRLQSLVDFLRDRHFYCFWCKFKYPDSAMDGCPGTSEEDHG